MVSEEYIRRLYIEKTMGVISEDDDRWLQEELLQHPKSRKFWQKLNEDNCYNRLETFMDRVNVTEDLSVIKARLVEKSRVRSIRNWLPYAAAFVLLTVAGAFLYIYTDKGNNLNRSLVESHSPKSNAYQVQLLVGDGEEVVNLDGENKVLKVAGQQIQKEGEMLIYGDNNTVSRTNTLLVPPTKDYKLLLADGTKVWLNSSSELKFPMSFSGNSREVFLKGEAYFEIASKADQPFIVHTDKASVNVLGTKFNLNAYADNQVVTTLLEGKVRLESPSGETLVLSPGLSGHYSKTKGFSQEKFDPVTALSWKEGLYYFHGITLIEISEMIKRWFDLPVNFESNELKHVRISGLLDKKNLKGFLEDLNTTAGVRAVVIDGTLHFRL
ncbi:FecR domain-containing protein [Olivibacter sp. CPCC 100613]|uniref:FecR family protein n=1 Tax=Olivibacter sp. CPCC 100613 TaxID=3079931 RepID=UPI002FF9E728